jgi:hypothetical protein
MPISQLRPFIVFPGLLLLSTLSGCASLMSGHTQEVSFQSVPPGAAVIVDGRTLGQTPLSVQLDRKTSQSLTITKNGYVSNTRPLIKVMNPWFWGNIPLGGIFIGMTVDRLSGSDNEFVPSSYSVTLQPEQTIASTLVREEREQLGRDFIITYYKEIRSDIAKGGGKHLSTLMDTLNIPEENQSDALDRIRTLAEFHTNVKDFANAVVDDLSNHSYDKRNPLYRAR